MLTYYLILLVRHLFYDKGWIKSVPVEVPSVCIGNVAAGGTGKTPITELVIRTLQDKDVPSADAELYGFDSDAVLCGRKMRIAVLSRGYRRRTKGFQQVTADGTAERYGDEPLQMKRKFPDVTVAVDADRVEGCDFLVHPDRIGKLPKKCLDRIISPEFPAADYIVLDDAFQHRRIRAGRNIVLTTYDRPYFSDFLLPLGRLRDLRKRVQAADMVIVTKCPPYISDEDKKSWAGRMGLSDFDCAACEGSARDGRRQKILFSTVAYDSLNPVFADADPRYVHSKNAVLFSGIADDKPLATHLSEMYRLVSHKRYPDHHYFKSSDINDILSLARQYPTAVFITTEKDAQRLNGTSVNVPDELRHRMFYAPIHVQMLTAAEQYCLKKFLI
ncbi:MAG: tetraacyldisaccharide 4'-kinase [Bacteroidales bacterium]|nr:tetraacyldisaccharide 4'-kinase [Candidatus Hennigimonas equi]